MLRTAILAAVLGFCGTFAQAAGCPPADGETIPELEALNQQVLDLDFAGLSTAIEGQTGMNVRGGLDSIGNVYGAGFDGCTTLAQRIDTGGMTQTVVMYHGKAGPLFGYWRTATVKGRWTLLSFGINSAAEEILDKLR